jgi:hypothetical protein
LTGFENVIVCKTYTAARWVVGAAALFSCAGVRAQVVIPDRIVPDTAVIQRQYEESNRFYERLERRAEDSRLARWLYRALVSEDDRTGRADPPARSALEREVDYFRQFEGRRINAIRIFRNNVFSDTYPKGDLRRLANSLHGITREDRIRRNLLFREGESLDAALFARNEQMLRAQDYLADAYIVIEPAWDDEGVDIYVITRDSWSIGGTVRSVPHNARRYIDLYDSNILGSGNRLDLRTYVGFKGKMYGGNMLEYQATNLWGSFFDLEALAGIGYQERRLGIGLRKPFILPTDFMAGAAARYDKFYEWQTMVDTALLVGRRDYDVFAGKSWDFPATNSSFYVAARYQDQDWFAHPTVRTDTNTYYHSRRMVLVSTGIYRETWYRGNMIFGYGTTENIPYGHRFEFTGGRYWSEFGDRWYGAFTAAAGRALGRGYLRAEATISSFFTDYHRPERSALGFRIDAFSGLWPLGRSHLRQFLRIHYLAGFDRSRGEGETLTFFGEDSPEGFRFQPDHGKVRLTVAAESVLFTPVYLYGFRFAFFAFGDVGWLGNHNLPFRNDPYASVGVGVRLKNERLVLNTFQIRLGVGFSTRRGWVDYRHVRFSSESRLLIPTFRAQEPGLYLFR